jgi:ADP-ribosyl-[dinitrogen reductase] hydrolase
MDRYLDWYQNGYLSSNGRCFDIGNTVRSALSTYRRSGDPYSGSTDPHSAGNGSLMRLAPIPMFYFPDRERVLYYAAESSRTTHGAQECLDACRLFGDMLFRALAGAGKDEILNGDSGLAESGSIKAIARGDYRDKQEAEIRGSGYVVESLEAALWCFWRTDSFQSAILRAANLGDDADTTAAVCGQIAGAFYGVEAIPGNWLERLVMRAEITRLADLLARKPAGGIVSDPP